MGNKRYRNRTRTNADTATNLEESAPPSTTKPSSDAKYTIRWTIALFALGWLLGSVLNDKIKEWVTGFGSDGLAGSYTMPAVSRERLRASIEKYERESGVKSDVPASVSCAIYAATTYHLDGRGGVFASFFDFIDVKGSYKLLDGNILEVRLTPDKPIELNQSIAGEAHRLFPSVKVWRIEDVSRPQQFKISPRRDRLSLQSTRPRIARAGKWEVEKYFIDEFYLTRTAAN